MKRLIAVVLAACTVGPAGVFGPGIAKGDPGYPGTDLFPPPAPAADDSSAKVVYTLGGARPPNFPWEYYTSRAGSGFFPNIKRDIINYPAGAAFSMLGNNDRMSIGQAVGQGTSSLKRTVHQGTETAAVVGLSQGSVVTDHTQALLANDPKAPPPDQLTFTTFGDPSGTNAFGKSILAKIFRPGDYVPYIDLTMPQATETQYDSNRVIAAYDGLSDFPDRADNILALMNALAGAAIGHTPTAFADPASVPPQNIRTTVNSRGATETTYLVPANHLPLTMPLRYLGWSGAEVDQLDAVLQPEIDKAYSYNDNIFTKPVSVDPVNGMDPLATIDPESHDGILKSFAQVREIISAPPPD